MTTTTTTKRTTVVTEVPDERRWQGRDWLKALVAGGLALSLMRPGATVAPVAAPTAVAVATPLPAIVSTVVPTVAPTVAPAAEAPLILSTREAVQAGPYTVQGSGTPGSLVEVLVNGASVGTATVGADGRWSLPTTLEAGSIELGARAVDPAGAVIAEGEPITLGVQAAAAAGATATIGLPAAAAPVITTDLGAVAAGPVDLQGTGTPGSLVEILINGASVGTATVGADGAWTFPANVDAGSTEITARAVNESGAVIAEGEPVTVGDGAGAAVAVPTFNAPPGDLIGGPALLSGTGTPGTTVRVTVGGVDAGTAVVGPDGNWELDAILAAGRQPVLVEAIDASGATAAAAEPIEINVVGGLGVTLDEPVEGAELQPGPITVSGNGQAGTTLEILEGDKIIGEVVIGADGTWTTEVPLESGTSVLSVREKGSAQILNRPVRVTVGGPPVAAAGCGTELALTCPAWVTRSGGLSLRIRSAAAILPDNVLGSLPIGTEMVLEEGPEAADGFNWYRVTTEGGVDGWVAGENLVAQPD